MLWESFTTLCLSERPAAEEPTTGPSYLLSYQAKYTNCSQSTSYSIIPILSLLYPQVINAFSQADWMLKFIYRSSSMRAKIAGLAAIPLEPKIVNIDLTEVINGHLDYLDRMPEVLSYCGVKCKPMKATVNRFSLSGSSRSSNSKLNQSSANSSPSQTRAASFSLPSSASNSNLNLDSSHKTDANNAPSE